MFLIFRNTHVYIKKIMSEITQTPLHVSYLDYYTFCLAIMKIKDGIYKPMLIVIDQHGHSSIYPNTIYSNNSFGYHFSNLSNLNRCYDLKFMAISEIVPFEYNDGKFGSNFMLYISNKQTQHIHKIYFISIDINSLKLDIDGGEIITDSKSKNEDEPIYEFKLVECKPKTVKKESDEKYMMKAFNEEFG